MVRPSLLVGLGGLHGQPRDWPPGMVPNDAPRIVHELAATRLWLEQEAVVLDPRFAGELEADRRGRCRAG